jgi:gamma-glutamylcyclotransferase (GGCT)/AIG2-like uncharacterized protein YtfP
VLRKTGGEKVATEYIFVYGTLRRAAASNMYKVLTRYCEYVADGHMQGKLYKVAGYPGAIESASIDDRVHGEIYRILDKELLFAQLDEYEECGAQFSQPHEYVRKKLPVSVSGKEDMLAWIYLFNHDVAHLRQIRSGDYLSLKRH